MENELSIYLKKREGQIQKYKTEFNFFREMYNWSNERYLHSSLITMLLSQKDNRYRKDFIERLAKESEYKLAPELFNGHKLEIHPNKDDHTEKHNIDILIDCIETQSVIIIENKTLSHDRFTKNGEHQLLSYGEHFKNYNNVFYVYLTPRNMNPEGLQEFNSKNLICISYDVFIRDWIKQCIKICKDNFLKKLLKQYNTFMSINLDTRKRASELTEAIFKNQEFAYNSYRSKNNEQYRKDMIDVKWEVINDIIYGIINKLKEFNNISIDEEIQARRLNGMIIAASKTDDSPSPIVFNFTYKSRNGEEILLYLSYDAKGFTLGRCIENITEEDYVVLLGKEDGNINNFEKKNTFNLINKNEQNTRIDQIIQEIKTYLKLIPKQV